MSLSSSLTSIKINNNTVDIGTYSNGSSSTTYTYDTCIYISGDAIVTGNTISGCVGGSTGATVLLSIVSASCSIKNNNFIRGSGSPIGAYIAITGTNDQIITGNIFDQPTVDGSSDILVTGLTIDSQYYNNKNQTIYIPIPVAYAAERGVGAVGTVMAVVSENAGAFEVIADRHILTIINSGTTSKEFETNFTVNPFLPEGVRILAFKMGASRDNSGLPVLDGGFSPSLSLNVKSIDTVATNYSTGLNSILDPVNTRNNTLNNQTGSIDLSADFSNMVTTTSYITMDVSGNNYYVNNRNYIIMCQFMCAFKLSSGSATIRISPVVIQCRW